MNDLIIDLAPLVGLSEHMVWVGFIVFLRVGAVMALLPAFGEQVIPPRVRLALGFAFTLVIAPTVLHHVTPLAGELALPLLTEVLAGLLLGVGLRLFIVALQMAGTIIAQATSLAQLFGGAGIEPQPAVGHMLTMAGLALAVMAGLHVRVAEALIESYDYFPPGKLPFSADVASWGLVQVSQAFRTAFALSAPFLAGSLIYNVALGIINRAMPQLMVAFVGAPALTLGGMILMAIVLPLALALWMQGLQNFLSAPFEVPG